MRTIIDVSEQARKAADDEVFGLWRNREIQGRHYENKLRGEWSGRGALTRPVSREKRGF